jgi:hypothetical protein
MALNIRYWGFCIKIFEIGDVFLLKTDLGDFGMKSCERKAKMMEITHFVYLQIIANNKHL